MSASRLHLTGSDAADTLLSRDPLALLIGMLLDQQFPMERAFASPLLLAERQGVDTLDATALAGADLEHLTTLFRGPPALHRYPGSMAARTQELCALLVRDYDGDAAAVWTGATSATELRERLRALPGFGDAKSRIFLALLGKRLGVRPRGWREAAAPYGEDGSRRSIADVVDATTLAEVRATKQAAKAAAKAAAAT